MTSQKIKKTAVKSALLGYVATIILLSLPVVHGSSDVEATCLDTISGYSSLCKSSITAPNTEVTMKVTEPDGSVIRFPCVTNLEGIAKCDLNAFHTQKAGVYHIGSYFGGYDEPSVLQENIFQVYPDNISAIHSTVTTNKQSIEANGQDFAYITVELKDQYKNAIAKHQVDIISSRNDDVIEKITTNVSSPEGKVSFKTTSKTPGVSTFIVRDTVSSVTLTERPKIVFYQSSGSSVSPTLSSSSQYLKSDLFSSAIGGPISQLSIEAPDTVKVNESFDVTVKAIDSTGGPALAYKGTIFFSSPGGGQNAKLPLQNEGYKFDGTDTDATHKFAKSTMFTTTGTFTLVVTDIDNTDLEAKKTITVTSTGSQSNANLSTGGTMTISSPSSGATYSDTKVDIIGKMDQNTAFKVYDDAVEIGNGKDKSDSDGSFLFTAKGLADGKHQFKVVAIDAAGTETTQSSEVIITVDTKSAVLKEITLTPDKNITPNMLITVILLSEPKLSKVRVVVDSVARDLMEDPTTPGTYKGTINAPTKEGEYPIKVMLTNALGKDSTPDTNKKLTVLKGGLNIKLSDFKAIPGVTEGTVDLSWTSLAETTQFKNYVIYYDTNPITLSNKVTSTDAKSSFTLTGLKSDVSYYVAVSVVDMTGIEGPQSDILPVTPKLIMTKIQNFVGKGEDGKITFTWDDPKNTAIVKYKFEYGIKAGEYLESVVTKDAKTSWYLPDLINGLTYYVKLSGVDQNNAVVIGSDEISAIVGGQASHSAAFTCTPYDVQNIRIVVRGTDRILVWDALPGVTSYHIYAGTGKGMFNLPTTEVQTPYYTLPYLSKEYPSYFFAVKSVCSATGAESLNFSNILKVGSGPESIIILGISTIIIGLLYRRIRKAKKLVI